MVQRSKLKRMEKVYLKNGKEVKLGDTISHCIEEVDPIFGSIVSTISIKVTEYNLPSLLEAGIVVEAQDKAPIPMTIDYYVENLAKKMGWKIEKTINVLDNIQKLSSNALFSILLREVAVELDKKYKDHIENSSEIYVISNLNGRITKANKAAIKNYRNFASFRSVEDAKVACRILKLLLKDLYAKK